MEKSVKIPINKITDHGFREPAIDETHYGLGALKELKGFPEVILKPDGQYDNLPPREVQNRAMEPMNCTNYGTYNCLDIIEMTLYGTMTDKSERYGGVISGTTKGGNDPHTVAEHIRDEGMIPEEVLPYNDTINTWNKYYSPKPMTQKYLDMGDDWLDKYDFGHEWVWTNKALAIKSKQDLMMKWIKNSPLGVSVLAWQYRNGYYWKNRGEQDNHWCCCYGYVKDKYWKIYDSYDDTTKELEWNYDFSFCKRYYLNKKKQETNMEKTKLSQIYNELLMREPDELADGYLSHEEEFCRAEVGKSEERQQIIRLVEWARAWNVFNLLGLVDLFGICSKLKGFIKSED